MYIVLSSVVTMATSDTGLNAADMLTKSVGVGNLKVCKALAGMVISG